MQQESSNTKIGTRNLMYIWNNRTRQTGQLIAKVEALSWSNVCNLLRKFRSHAYNIQRPRQYLPTVPNVQCPMHDKQQDPRVSELLKKLHPPPRHSWINKIRSQNWKAHKCAPLHTHSYVSPKAEEPTSIWHALGSTKPHEYHDQIPPCNGISMRHLWFHSMISTLEHQIP